MATIRCFFIVLSVCVVCSFADDRFKKHDLLLLPMADVLGGLKFVAEDGKSPLHSDRSSSMLIIKKDSPAYNDVMKKIDENEALPHGDKFSFIYTFDVQDWRFGTINVEDN
ncbi:uncharacterized protein LOC126835184 [Adelges cooleyi]|uniref:uncharacterized protein LOC126835184 n=1 Tax=Adelges cooleyi TaxID=133065 RepID=UPI0021802ED7|nr:uncharacterized protein LOC126835184 [Adelges cooleyi]